MPPVESAGRGTQKPFHPRHQIGLGRLHHQVKVVGHQAEGMHLPVRFAAALGQSFQEAFSVGIIFEDRLPPVATAHHMVDRPFIFQSKLAWHRTEYCQKTPFVSIVRTDTNGLNTNGLNKTEFLIGNRGNRELAAAMDAIQSKENKGVLLRRALDHSLAGMQKTNFKRIFKWLFFIDLCLN